MDHPIFFINCQPSQLKEWVYWPYCTTLFFVLSIFHPSYLHRHSCTFSPWGSRHSVGQDLFRVEYASKRGLRQARVRFLRSLTAWFVNLSTWIELEWAYARFDWHLTWYKNPFWTLDTSLIGVVHWIVEGNHLIQTIHQSDGAKVRPFSKIQSFDKRTGSRVKKQVILKDLQKGRSQET